MSTDYNARPVRAEISATPTPLGVTEPTLVKLAEYGGFIASVLALCLFFWVLTNFVREVKKED